MFFFKRSYNLDKVQNLVYHEEKYVQWNMVAEGLLGHPEGRPLYEV